MRREWSRTLEEHASLHGTQRGPEPLLGKGGGNVRLLRHLAKQSHELHQQRGSLVEPSQRRGAQQGAQ